MKKITLGLAIASCLLYTGVSFAEKANITVKVNRILIQENAYGGCMINVSKNISTQASKSLNCPSASWVTLSCDGTYNKKDFAYRKLDIAQMAKATQRPITLFIDDTKKHNGYCFAYRVDI